MKKFFVFSAVVVAAFLAIGADARAEPGAEKSRTGVSVPPSDKGEGKAATESKVAKEGGKIASPAKKEAGPEKLGWTWKRDMKGVELGNLGMAWDGARFFLTITAPPSKKTDKKEGDIIAVIGKDGHIQQEISGNMVIQSLYVDGSGNQLMAETKDGKFLTWPEWEKESEPKAVAVDFPAGSTPSQTFKTAIFVNKEKKEAAIYGQDGKKLRSYPLASIPASVPAAWSPFFRDEEFVLLISAEGEATMFNRELKLWTLPLGAPVKAVASSYMKNNLLAFGAGDKIVFVDGKDGKVKAKAAFKAEKLRLDCSQAGNFCAAIGHNAKSQRLAAFSMDGKELWSHDVNVKAKHDFFKVQALEKGNMVIAGLETKEYPAIEAFDAKGTLLWIAPLRKEVKDYRVSWGGNAIAVLYPNDMTFYSMQSEPGKPAAE